MGEPDHAIRVGPVEWAILRVLDDHHPRSIEATKVIDAADLLAQFDYYWVAVRRLVARGLVGHLCVGCGRTVRAGCMIRITVVGQQARLRGGDTRYRAACRTVVAMRSLTLVS